MNVFERYAQYYDLLNQGKDYEAEADFVHRKIQEYSPGAESILDLGSGTGTHAILLAGEGYSVHGVDISEKMLVMAKARLSQIQQERAKRVRFSIGDIRTIRLEEKFDAVVALFHVMSYQTSNQALKELFSTAAVHLKPGGLFIFDCWYGPAVLSTQLRVSRKEYRDEEKLVIRTGEPLLDLSNNTVDMKFDFTVSRGGETEKFGEIHRMRYLFELEIELFCGQVGLGIRARGEWLTDRPLGADTRDAYFVAG